MSEQFKCFADESVFALHELLLEPQETIPLHFRQDAGFRLPADRCGCQGYEVLLKDGGIVGVKLAFSAKEPLDNVWFIPRTATSKTHLAKGDMDMHAIHLGNFKPSESNNGSFETMFKWKFPIVADRSLYETKTPGQASRPSQPHASLTSQGLDKLGSTSLMLTPMSALSAASSQHSKSSSSSSHLPLTVGSSELSPRRTSDAEQSFTFNSHADAKSSVSSSDDLSPSSPSSPNVNDQRMNLVRMHDTAQDQQCSLSKAIMGLVCEASESDIADDDSEEPTSPNSDSASSKSRGSVFSVVKQRISTIGQRLGGGKASKSTRSLGPPSSPPSRKLSLVESNEVAATNQQTDFSSELGDEESITELEVDDAGELVAVHASSPLLLSKKNFKQYRHDGRLTVSQQFYIVEGGGRVLARLRMRFIATCAPIPPLCSYCRKRFAKLRSSSNEQARLAPKHRQTADVLFVRSDPWKQSLFYSLMKRDDAQVIPYVKLIEMQERMFEHPSAPRAVAATPDDINEDFDPEEHRDFPSGMPAHQRVGKFLNFTDFETQVAKMVSVEQADSTSFLEARDGAKLAYLLFKASAEPVAIVLFIATFGFGSAWCLDLASRLAKNNPFHVIVQYERGHGPALDPSGDAPSKEALWRDMRTMIRYLRWNYPALPLVVGGHSNGAGKLLNYNSWKSSLPADAIFLISPFLHELMRSHKRNMTKKDHFQRKLNSMSGGRLAGHWIALDLTNHVARKEIVGLCVPTLISVNMMAAVLIKDAKAAFSAISVPFALWAGSEDELFPSKEVLAAADYSPSQSKVAEEIEGGTHVGIVNMIEDHLAPWIKRIIPPIKARLDAELARQAAVRAARRERETAEAPSSSSPPASTSPSSTKLAEERSSTPSISVSATVDV
ncbi:hypothetical protein CAOG_09221 [Capsaspora owczarzaki ATCC 30864]|uniref:Serine aminopeptidase S33 domain-containing protein n=1 Tax=Capsaspora owczarzaki (strain ATCC 30864) TaxID=595528 RepID=A0A0D2W1V3_CAPO3|nr:hypothetical protein CAOG_09221 [Capsaspora owczarzaki ATCC 30864]KJE98327.1 hypothetical protein CAOG_009221 [Capsaspora owczarzaki ATCC 30864]|eukprot:XP_011270931.1 hypothetical protein CAOG_09221 [Capsaspora owczarzaki ATCC 30864]